MLKTWEMLENVESEQSLVVSIHTIFSLKNFGRILSTIGWRKKQIENRKQINLLDCVISFCYCYIIPKNVAIKRTLMESKTCANHLTKATLFCLTLIVTLYENIKSLITNGFRVFCSYFFLSHHIFLCLWFSKVCYSDNKVQVLLACFVEINFIGDFLLLRWCMQFYASIAQMEFSISQKRKLR